MRKSKHSERGLRKISWVKLREMINPLGWMQTKDAANAKYFDRGNERIALFKMGGKWKVDYFVAGRLEDSAVLNEEDFAKLLVGQMAMK